MIDKRFCKECGGEVSIHVITPDTVWAISDDGKLKRDDNNDACFGISPHVDILCDNDTEHETGIDETDIQWFEEIDEALEKEGVL